MSRNKIMSLSAVLLLQSYATFELIRVVWLYRSLYYLEDAKWSALLLGEIGLIAVCYLLLIPFLWWRLKE